MSPEAQQIAIAKTRGWTDVEMRWHTGVEKIPTGLHPLHGPHSTRHLVPDSLADLNAMHDAEKVLTVEQAEEYADWLVFITNANMAGSAAYLWYIVATATAAQRAEAFLRTLGKWEDGK